MERSSGNRRERGSREVLGELLADLPRETRQALNNPVRRKILRMLNDSETPCTSREIALAVMPQKSKLRCVNYHTLLLANQGSVKVTGARPIRGALARSYASNVAGDRQITTVLQASRELDQVDG